MNSWLKKLTSRKFLVSLISMAAGIAAICGADMQGVEIIAGAAMTVLPAIVYCLTEGKIDAASVHKATDAITDAAQALGATASTQQMIQAAGDMLEACAPSKAQLSLDGTEAQAAE